MIPAIVMVNDEVLAKYDTVKADTSSLDVFMFDTGWMKTHPEKAQELSAYNEVIVARAEAAGSEPVENNLLGYKYDSALGLLIGNLIPRGTGLLGFILAALLGAIVSSLAAVLNASSTIFTMDIYSEHINKKATQFQLVTVGRVCVAIFVIIGCVVSPLLANPKFGGIFKYIQEFQGYASPGILAVFVFGLINRTSKGFVGVVGLVLNPILYGIIAFGFKSIAFLDRMAICFFVVLTVMTVLGLMFKNDKPVEFESDTDMDLSTSKGARLWGIIVVVLTLVLYGIFR